MDGEVAGTQVIVAHINNNRFSHPTGAQANNSHNALNAVHYKQTTDRLEQMAGKEGSREKDENKSTKIGVKRLGYPLGQKSHTSCRGNTRKIPKRVVRASRAFNVSKGRFDTVNEEFRPFNSTS